MGVKLTNSRSRSNKYSSRNITCDINITPLVDVMLVLLVIFMVTSPMLVAGINVDLPETKASPIVGQGEPLVLTINKNGDLFIAETKITRSHLKDKLLNITKEKKDTRIFVRGDKSVSYGNIVDVIAEVHAAGFTKVALISNIKHNEK
jgi:biopolymer transport protein TolR